MPPRRPPGPLWLLASPSPTSPTCSQLHRLLGGGSSTEPLSSPLPTEPRPPALRCPLRPPTFLFSLPLSAGSSKTSPLRPGPASSGRLMMVGREEALQAVLAVLALLVAGPGPGGSPVLVAMSAFRGKRPPGKYAWCGGFPWGPVRHAGQGHFLPVAAGEEPRAGCARSLTEQAPLARGSDAGRLLAAFSVCAATQAR